jgi:hypothetical protein
MPGFRSWCLPIAAGVVLALLQVEALARGSQVAHDAPWNSEHIERLPPEIRDAVSRMCTDTPRAGHYFATYLDHAHVVRLHFEHLHCEDRPRFCKDGGCLHQEYVSTGGHYRLIRNYYGSGND